MLKPKQRKTIELMMQGNMTQKEIAKAVGVAEETICHWKKKNEFMAELNSLIHNSIRATAAKALSVHTKLLDANNEMVRYLTAKDILDRAGYKSEDMMKVIGSTVVVISGEGNLAD